MNYDCQILLQCNTFLTQALLSQSTLIKTIKKGLEQIKIFALWFIHVRGLNHNGTNDRQIRLEVEYIWVSFVGDISCTKEYVLYKEQYVKSSIKQLNS